MTPVESGKKRAYWGKFFGFLLTCLGLILAPNLALAQTEIPPPDKPAGKILDLGPVPAFTGQNSAGEAGMLTTRSPEDDPDAAELDQVRLPILSARELGYLHKPGKFVRSPGRSYQPSWRGCAAKPEYRRDTGRIQFGPQRGRRNLCDER